MVLRLPQMICILIACMYTYIANEIAQAVSKYYMA